MFRLYVERKQDFQNEARRIYSELTGFLGISGVTGVRYLNRYDIENTTEQAVQAAAVRIFSEPQSDVCYFTHIPLEEHDTIIEWEYLPGQYDQRSDSAEQCLSLLLAGLESENKANSSGNSAKPRVRCAKLVILTGTVSANDVERIQHYLINPVDSRLANPDIPESLEMKADIPADIPVLTGFNKYSEAELNEFLQKKGLAMDSDDIKFLQSYFKGAGRDPTETEIRVLDTYWSDHCRHTTFNTVLDKISVDEGEYKAVIDKAFQDYAEMRTELYAERINPTSKKFKPVTLMDMACIGAKYLKAHGKLDDIELSEEINACSIFIDVHYKDTSSCNDDLATDHVEKWLLQFKNETHNHPTEIEPFGGAATCIGGAIRDPLSGRAWVYQALRVTGAADPTVPLSQTRDGKLPQMKLTREAAQGFSSYGNQIGLTTGQVAEIYHPGFEAKRMELGAVIAAVPADRVKREEPDAGDIVVLIGGGTGRDGIGGATGSSKVHTTSSVTTAAAEVQKGNAVEERKIQRMFRNPAVANMIRRCNDFGAGGVAVAVGELAPGLDINLDAVPKKYDGLNGTELAISESQERMALVVRAKDVEALQNAAAAENLNSAVIATVTNTNRLVMKWRGKTIVDIERSFLDTAGASRNACAHITSPDSDNSPLCAPLDSVASVLNEDCSCSGDKNASTSGDAKKGLKLERAWKANISDLACCSQRGLSERFDGSIGSSSVLFPMGGKYQSTPEAGMAAKVPVLPPYETETTSLMSFGYDPRVSSWSPYHGAQNAVIHSLARISAMGGNPESSRLTFQEYFERTVSPESWGKPAAALLGALSVQKAMGTPSIGGKDSMSGSFQDIHVPPTLVSFAVAMTDARKVASASFKNAGSKVYLVHMPLTDKLEPDYKSFTLNTRILYELNNNGLISAINPVGAGGIAEAVTKMSFGNKIGFNFDNDFYAKFSEMCSVRREKLLKKGASCTSWLLFLPLYGSFLVESSSEIDLGTNAVLLGETTSTKQIHVKAAVLDIDDLEKAWEAPLAKVFPQVSSKAAEAEKNKELPAFATKVHESLTKARNDSKCNNNCDTCKKANASSGARSTSKAKPRVLLPVFPGTNCEYDMARAFALSGGDTKILVFRNNTPAALADSLAELASELDKAQILALSGGFSAGDEPDGSGKFIANVIREPRIADAVMSLLNKRDGLVLGICNGFQALVKTGLVPYGKILEPSEDMPTLTYNTVGRHISRIVRTRVVSAATPWASNLSVIEPAVHLIPISHGEGRIIIDSKMAQDLFNKGQIFTQYCDENGIPVMNEPDNPNGSMFAIEGMMSENGHILGKMGHSERTIGTEEGGFSSDLIKNIALSAPEGTTSCQNIFASGISYFD